MRRLPRTLISALTLLALLTAAGCGDDDGSGRNPGETNGAAPGDRVSAEPSPRPLAGTAWKVTDVTPGGLPKGAERAAHFTLGKDGLLQGNLGCNGFSAKAKAVGDTITLEPVISTKKLCPGARSDLEDRVKKVLEGTVTYTVDGHDLTLGGPKGTSLRATAH
ncbi:META domain-containing protein [Streptomyces sp. NPDC058953]|uniref:META domain-containing protein n=1 Tax=unclassified Streptomyces TaxID=2593676 RepID=UPI0036BEB0FD